MQEVAESLVLVLDRHPEYRAAKILERIIEPERVIMFRVPWMDDQGEVRINRGFRIQMNSAIGPYKGGLRFHPSVNLGILKFLAFEQVFKNSLTTLPMGGGKGGSDFDPKGKSDHEVMRFCQSFMTELYRHIGPDTDVPAGDIGVGGREIGFLFGQYRRIVDEFTGVLTGKGIPWGGSLIRPEATGYGAVYFAANMLQARNQSFEGKTCLVSGSGNVSQYTVEKLNQLGAKTVTLSDSNGYVYDPEGVDEKKLALRDGPQERAPRPHQGVRGEVQERDLHPARPESRNESAMGPQGGLRVPERHRERDWGQGRGEPPQERRVRGLRRSQHALDPGGGGAVHRSQSILYGPGKAANAGGVAVSGLEMSQNSSRWAWSREEVDSKLQVIMKNIHNTCVEASARFGTPGNYVNGANIGGFLKVANAMLDQGLV